MKHVSRASVCTELLSKEIAQEFKSTYAHSKSHFANGASIGFEGNSLEKIADLIADRSWEEIDWCSILNNQSDAWHVPDLLSQQGYCCLFPSFLVHCSQAPVGSLLCDLFIESHLNTKNVYDENKLQFYSELNDTQAACVAKVLDYARSRGNALAQDALDSYWILFLRSDEK